MVCPPDTSIRWAVTSGYRRVAGWRSSAQYPRERPPVPAPSWRQTARLPLRRPAQPTAKIGGDSAGGDGIDGDAAPAQLAGHVHAQHLHSRFGGGVGGEARIGDAGQPGGKVNDPSAVCQQRQQGLYEENTL